MKKREFVAWILLPIDRNKKLKFRNEYAFISKTKKFMETELGIIPPGVKTTKVKVIEI